MEREIRELRQANEILRNAALFAGNRDAMGFGDSYYAYSVNLQFSEAALHIGAFQD